MRRVRGQVGVVRWLHAPRRPAADRRRVCSGRCGFPAHSSRACLRGCRQLGCSRRRFARCPRVTVGPRCGPAVAVSVTRWRQGWTATAALALEGR